MLGCARSRRAISRAPRPRLDIRASRQAGISTAIAGEIAELDVYLFPTGHRRHHPQQHAAGRAGDRPAGRRVPGRRDRRPVRFDGSQRVVRRSAVGRFVREGGARAGGETIWPSGSRRARWRCTTHLRWDKIGDQLLPRSTGNLVARHDEEPVRLGGAITRRSQDSVVVERGHRTASAATGIRSGSGACATAARAQTTEGSARMNPQPMKYSACQTWSNVRLPAKVSRAYERDAVAATSSSRPFQESCRRARVRHQARAWPSR